MAAIGEHFFFYAEFARWLNIHLLDVCREQVLQESRDEFFSQNVKVRENRDSNFEMTREALKQSSPV